MTFLLCGLIAFILLAFAITLVVTNSTGNKDNYGRKPSVLDCTMERRGKEGERTINRVLTSLLNADEYLLTNILLPLKNGHKTEIDSILITRKGIFCIETKNWVGRISGDDDSEYWIQIYDDPTISSRQHRNPVKQNKSHCEILSRILKNKYVVMNFVIFVSLEYGTELYSNYAYTIDDFIEYYDIMQGDKLTSYDIEKIYNKLKSFEATDEEIKAHADDLKSIYKDK